MKKSIATLLLVVAFVGCNSSKRAQKEGEKAGEVPIEEVQTPEKNQNLTKEVSADSLFARYERTPCFGRCPTFKFKLFNNGFVVYEGIRFVENEGLYFSTVPKASIDTILSIATAIGFFEMEDEYDTGVTDLPSTLLTIKKDSTEKKVINRHMGPEALKKLNAYYDRLIQRTAWTPWGSKKP